MPATPKDLDPTTMTTQKFDIQQRKVAPSFAWSCIPKARTFSSTASAGTPSFASTPASPVVHPLQLLHQASCTIGSVRNQQTVPVATALLIDGALFFAHHRRHHQGILLPRHLVIHPRQCHLFCPRMVQLGAQTTNGHRHGVPHHLRCEYASSIDARIVDVRLCDISPFKALHRAGVKACWDLIRLDSFFSFVILMICLFYSPLNVYCYLPSFKM